MFIDADEGVSGMYGSIDMGECRTISGLASQTITTCPIQEWLIQAGARDSVFMKHKLEPFNGYIDLPNRPGLGMELDEDSIDSMASLIL